MFLTVSIILQEEQPKTQAVRCVTLCPSAELSSSPACKGYEPEYAATSNALCVTRSCS